MVFPLARGACHSRPVVWAIVVEFSLDSQARSTLDETLEPYVMRLRMLLAAVSVAVLSGCVSTQSQYAHDGYYRAPNSGNDLAYEQGYGDDYYGDDYYDDNYYSADDDDYADDGYYLDPDADYGEYGYNNQYYDNSVYYGDYIYYRIRPIVQISFNIVFGHGGYHHYYRPYRYYGHGYYPYAYWGYWPGYNPYNKPHKPRNPKPDNGHHPAPERPIVDNERPRGQPRAPRPIEPPYRPRPQTEAIGNGSNPGLQPPIVHTPPRQEMPRRRFEAPRQERPDVPRQPNQNRERTPREFVMLQTPQADVERRMPSQQAPRRRSEEPRQYEVSRQEQAEIPRQPNQNRQRAPREQAIAQAPESPNREPRPRAERQPRPAKPERARDVRSNNDSDEP
jgi:hypothetical protein